MSSQTSTPQPPAQPIGTAPPAPALPAAPELPPEPPTIFEQKLRSIWALVKDRIHWLAVAAAAIVAGISIAGYFQRTQDQTRSAQWMALTQAMQAPQVQRIEQLTPLTIDNTDPVVRSWAQVRLAETLMTRSFEKALGAAPDDLTRARTLLSEALASKGPPALTARADYNLALLDEAESRWDAARERYTRLAATPGHPVSREAGERLNNLARLTRPLIVVPDPPSAASADQPEDDIQDLIRSLQADPQFTLPDAPTPPAPPADSADPAAPPASPATQPAN